MLAKVWSCAVIGLEGALVEVEVDLSRGLPSFTIVGLPDAAVQEAKERVRSAVRNSGGVFPNQRVTVNMAPADLRKAGTRSSSDEEARRFERAARRRPQRPENETDAMKRSKSSR